jgi:translocator protein
MSKLIKFILSVALPLTIGAVAGFFTSESVRGWFQTINKPSFNPPSWVFAPVWTTLYILMGIAFYLIWIKPKSEKRDRAIIFYLLQLILNGAWSFIFFYAQQPGWAFAEIVVLWLMIIITMALFYQVSKPSVYFLIPYLLWVSFASILNFSIWSLNS